MTTFYESIKNATVTGILKKQAKKRTIGLLLWGKNNSQHLQSHIIVVVVVVVVDIAIVQVDIGVAVTGRRGRPHVGLPTGRRFALSLAVAPCGFSPGGALNLAVLTARLLVMRRPIGHRGKRQQHSRTAPFATSRNRWPHEAPG